MSTTPERLAAALADRYRIERSLGAGGMATVYLAADLKHDRKVAIKVLKPELAAVLGAERFVQEIKTTAALSHPHILPLFDSGEADGFLYYVMPYIEGETIRDRLNRETQLGVDEAVRITCEIADALDYAHRHGVIHRDIKPENLLLHDGRAMVMDFGIALAVSAAAGGRMTETGLSLGTPHYMSPEQATADKDITARSDVYSLASVLFEMLAGEPPHGGGSAQAIIMKIIAEPAPSVSKLRRAVPAHVAAAVATALEKLPADRFATARAFADALANPHYTQVGGTAAGAAATPQRRATERLGLAAALVVALGLAGWMITHPTPEPPVVAFRMSVADEATPERVGVLLLSPDGEQLIYSGGLGAASVPGRLWIKRRDAVDPVLIPGTEIVTAAALSPDSRFLAVVQGRALARIPLAGGTGTIISRGALNVPYGVAWLEDETILFVGLSGRVINQVPAAGGEIREVWSSDTLSAMGLTPLPGGRAALFVACTGSCSQTSLWALNLRTGEAKRIHDNVRFAQLLATGELLFVEAISSTAFVTAFDAKALRLSGQPRAVLDSVGPLGSSSYLAVSRSGTLAYRRGAAAGRDAVELVAIDRAGRATVLDSSFTFRLTAFAGDFGWRLSPDGRQLAIGLNTSSGDDIWGKAIPRGPLSRLTFGQGAERRPRWLSSGSHISFVGADGIYLRRADGAGSDSLLMAGEFNEGAVSPDGKWLVVRRGAQGAIAGGRDIFAKRLGSADTLSALIVSQYDEHSFEFSPDGRWMAYASDEAGRQEILVRPFPNTGDAKFQVSVGGGFAPLWSRDGRELYYMSEDHRLMAVPVRAGAGVTFGEPQALFSVPQAMQEIARSWYTPYDVTADGRFLMVRRSSAATADLAADLIVIENWLSTIKNRDR